MVRSPGLIARPMVLVALSPGAARWTTAQDAPPKAQPSEPPPYKRALKGGDAARVAKLERQITTLMVAFRFDEAVNLAREVAAIRSRVQGADHWQSIDADTWLRSMIRLSALPVNGQKRWSYSRQLLQEALTLGQSRPAEAEPLFNEVLEIRRRVLGEGHRDLALVDYGLATQRAWAGRSAEAEPYYRKALEIRRHELSEDQPETAKTYYRLAVNRIHLGQPAEAEFLSRKALEIYRRVEGPDNLHVAQSLDVVALSLSTGTAWRGRAAFRRVLEFKTRLLGEGHRETALTGSNLATSLLDQGRYAKAEARRPEISAELTTSVGNERSVDGRRLRQPGGRPRATGAIRGGRVDGPGGAGDP